MNMKNLAQFRLAEQVPINIADPKRPSNGDQKLPGARRRNLVVASRFLKTDAGMKPS